MSPYINPLNSGPNMMGSQLADVQKVFGQASARLNVPTDLAINGGVKFQAFLNPASGSASAPGAMNQMMMGSMQSANAAILAPDALMAEYMRGGQVELHDIMMAGAKSELAVNLVSRTLTKVVQTYDRISQIQI